MKRNNYILTLLIALVGALTFILLGFPLPWLFGPLFACLIFALLGTKLKANKPIGDGMRTILGVAAGATVTPDFFLSLPSMVTTLMLVPILTIIIGVVGVIYFKRLLGYDFHTAYYASMPGGLQDMVILGEEAGANVRAISLIHATRVLLIVIFLPIFLTALWNADLDKPPGVFVQTFEGSQIAILALCAIGGWQVAKRIGMFGASILGPLICAAIAALTGILTTRPPAEAIWAAQYFIAIGIGVKYVGITGAEIKRDILAAIGFCILITLLTLVVIFLALEVHASPPIETVLSLIPGGQAELVVLALIVGADMAFVVSHHLLRIFFVILGAPIIVRLIPKKFRD